MWCPLWHSIHSCPQQCPEIKREQRNMCLALRIWVAGGRGVWKSIHKRQKTVAEMPVKSTAERMVRGEAQQWEHQSMARQRRRTNFSAVHGGYQAVLPSPCWPCVEADSTGILESGSMCVSTTMFIYLSVILSIGVLSYPLVIHLSVHISVSVPIHLSLHMFTMHLASVCPLVCLLMSLFPTILQKIVSGLQKTHTINRLYIRAWVYIEGVGKWGTGNGKKKTNPPCIGRT